MYENWYYRFLPSFNDSLAQYHQSYVIKADRLLQFTRAIPISDHEICDWVRRNQDDYLIRAMCAKLNH